MSRHGSSGLLPTLCAALISLGFASGLSAAPLENSKAVSLARPAVVEVRAAPTLWIRFASGQEEKTYGPYRLSAVGSGVMVSPDGFVVTSADLVTPRHDAPDRLHDLFVQHMLGLYEQEAGRDLTAQEESRIVVSLHESGLITMVNAEGGLIGGADEIPVQVRVGPALSSREGWGHPAEIRWLSPVDRKGLAILKIDGSDLPAARLGDSLELHLQSPLTVLSHDPERTTAGHIVSFETWKDGSPVLGTDMEGPSSGPAINAQGEVMGMVASGPSEPHTQGFPRVFLRPINDIKELLRAAGVTPEPGRHDGLYLEAMEHFWIAREADQAGRIGVARKEYQKAATLLREMLVVSPGHLEARRHGQWAEVRLGRLPRGMGEGFLAGAAAALAFAALGVVAVAVLRIHRILRMKKAR